MINWLVGTTEVLQITRAATDLLHDLKVGYCKADEQMYPMDVLQSTLASGWLTLRILAVLPAIGKTKSGAVKFFRYTSYPHGTRKYKPSLSKGVQVTSWLTVGNFARTLYASSVHRGSNIPNTGIFRSWNCSPWLLWYISIGKFKLSWWRKQFAWFLAVDPLTQ